MKQNPITPPRALAHLRLLATSDLHMQLTGYDYYADRTDLSVGLTRTAGLIHAARDEAAQSRVLTLLFDNGDSLQGTPLGDLAAQNPDRMHPLMQAFKHLQYDAIGLGNHDFNFGLVPLLAALTHAPCPVVCSNLRGLNGQKLPGIEPFALLDRYVAVDGTDHPIRIGVLAFLPPQTVLWDAHHLQGRLAVDDILSVAPRHIACLRRQACDLIIVLAHSGLDDGPVHRDMENAILPLAALDGIDAVIAGHTHLRLPGNDHGGMKHVDTRIGAVHGKPVVMPGTAGSHLGVIDLQVAADPGDSQDRWQVERFDCALRPVLDRAANGNLRPTAAEDPVLSDYLAHDHAATRTILHQPVGHTDQPLHSYFSFFAPDRSMAVVAAAQAAALRPLLVGTKADGLPVLSATSPCKFGARSGPRHYTDVPAGVVSLRHIADLHVFPNELRAVIVSADQILQWLERAARLFNQITPGSTDMPLTDAALPGHDFDVLHGLTWQIDLSAKARNKGDAAPPAGTASRIGDVRYAGQPLAPDQRFVVALNNHRANGGGNFGVLAETEPIPIPPLSIRDILRDYLSGALPADPLAEALPAWRFKPMPQTRVRVQTGPGAAAYLDELSGRDVTVKGTDLHGFLHLCLPL